MTEIRTERLRLVPCSRELAEALNPRNRRPPEELETILGACVEAMFMALPAAYLGRIRNSAAALGVGPWWLVDVEERALVGECAFSPHGDVSGVLELSYQTAGRYRGRGYATEAVRALVPWALAREGIDGLVAHCARDNAASIRVLESTGFRRTGEDDSTVYWACP